MANQTTNDAGTSSGVDALIARLRDEGVSAGRTQADKLVADARAEAKSLVDKASADARERLETARKEADAYRAAGEEALKTAMRDTVLDMKSRLMSRFGADVKRLVSRELQNKDLLKAMILEIAGRAGKDAEVAEADELELILPEKVVGLEELRSDPKELQGGRLTQYVLGVTGEMLRDGVTLAASPDVAAGVRVRIKKQDVTVEVTDEAVAALLLQHLQPRFRAILEGIVK